MSGLIERLCHALAYHLAETELTLQHAQGDLSEWRAEIEKAKTLLAEAGYPYDIIYPPDERPHSAEVH